MQTISLEEIIMMQLNGELKTVDDWNNLSIFYILTEEIIKKYIDKWNDYGYIIANQKLSESFIEKYICKSKKHFSWGLIFYHQKLSEKFIEKHMDKLNEYKCWFTISKYQKLSEEFIEKYKDNVDWSRIFQNQQLSKSFMKKYRDIYDSIYKNNNVY